MAVTSGGSVPTCHDSLSLQRRCPQPRVLTQQRRRRCQVSRDGPAVPTPSPHHACGLPRPPAACWAGGQRLASAAAGLRGAPGPPPARLREHDEA